MYSYITLGWLWAKAIKLNALGKKNKGRIQECWDFCWTLTPSHPHWNITVTFTKQFEIYFSFHISSPDINKPIHKHKIKHIYNQVSQTLV